MRKYTVRSRKFYRSYLEALVITLFVGLALRFFVVAPYKIPTSTMAPALLSGDYVFVFKLPFGAKLPFFGKAGEVQNLKRGDVVLFSYARDPDTKFIKRVLGLPGDRIEYKDRELIINGETLSYELLDPTGFSFVKSAQDLDFFSEAIKNGSIHTVIYNKEHKPEELGPIVVPDGEVFLLGDHRDNSDDSRYWGMVPTKNLDGKVVSVWFSVDPESSKVRWDRIFSSGNL
jgi:signal peptidase I